MHLRQRLILGALAGGVLIADLSLSGPAMAAGGAVGPDDAQITNNLVSTQVSVSENDVPIHGIVDPSGNYTLVPSCWLSPFGGDGATPVATDTPDEFGNYLGPIIAAGLSGGAGPVESANATEFKAIYQVGQSFTNGVVGLKVPPYNTGLSDGTWNWIVCTSNADYQTIVDLENELNATGPEAPWESWFWLNDGNPPVAGSVVPPYVLADYAAANMSVSENWPSSSPPLSDNPRAAQTVNVPTTLSIDPGNDQGYQQDSATAELTLDPAIFSTVTAVPTQMVISSPALPGPVTCDFNTPDNGAAVLTAPAGGPCQVTFDQASPAGGTPVTAAIKWTVNWAQAPAGSNWPQTIPITLTQNVMIQEIQTVVNHGN